MTMHSHYKPLVRWTVGPVSWEGIHCLWMAVTTWRKIYGEIFDYAICHNDLTRHRLEYIKRLDVKLVDLRIYKELSPITPVMHQWQLLPSRLNPNGAEIYVDNDLILYKPHPHINALLSDNIPFCDTRIDSCIYGLPPGVDLAETLMASESISCALKRLPKLNIIPVFDIHTCDEFYAAPYGVHFSGVNRDHTGPWEFYRRSARPML